MSHVINRNILGEEATRLRVETAIQELDYKPNLMAKGLRIKRSNFIVRDPKAAH